MDPVALGKCRRWSNRVLDGCFVPHGAADLSRISYRRGRTIHTLVSELVWIVNVETVNDVGETKGLKPNEPRRGPPIRRLDNQGAGRINAPDNPARSQGKTLPIIAAFGNVAVNRLVEQIITPYPLVAVVAGRYFPPHLDKFILGIRVGPKRTKRRLVSARYCTASGRGMQINDNLDSELGGPGQPLIQLGQLLLKPTIVIIKASFLAWQTLSDQPPTSEIF